MKPGTSAPRPVTDIPHALERREEIRARLDGRAAFFLDYDGTLTPIVDRPELAHLPDRMGALLEELASTHKVVIVSGRDLLDLQEQVGLGTLFYAGSHGFEITGPDGLRWENEDACALLDDLDEARTRLATDLAAIEGAQIERKRFSLAVHYRHVAPETVEPLLALVDMVIDQGRLRRKEGKMVVELQPDVSWNKGKAVQWMMKHFAVPDPPVPLYIGDDLTDEDALHAVSGPGVGVVVGGRDRVSHAGFRLDDTGEVETLLRFLATRGG